MTTTSQKEIAVAERELYEAARPEERAGGIAKFIHKLDGTRQRCVALRSVLLRAGREADPLWVEVDAPIKPMTLDAAVDILRVARAERREVADVIADFRADRRKRYTKTASTRRTCPADPLAHVRSAIAAWIESEVPKGDGESATIAKQVIAEIEGSIRAARDRLRKRIASPNDLSTLTGPARSEVRKACALLGLEMPRHHGAFDMAAVNRARRGMLRASHPDVVGDESRVSAYQAVNDAYAVIVAHNDSVAPSVRRHETEKKSGTSDGAESREDQS